MTEQPTQKQTNARPGRRVQAILILALVALLAVTLAILWAVLAAQSRPARVARPTPEWVTGAARTARTGALVVVGLVGLGMAYSRALQVYDDVTARRRQAVQDRLTEEHIKTQNELHNIRAIPADERGRYPLLYGVNGVLRDPNNLRAFTLKAVLETWPALEHIDAVTRAVIGAGGWPTPQTAAAMLPEQGQVVTLQPSTLDGLIAKYSFQPTLHNILIGEYVDAGATMPLTLSIPHAVHVLCTGASGLGKSTLLEAVALQLAGLDDVQLAAIDYGSGTFDGLESALHWQIADTPELAIALLRELLKLCEQRKALYKQVGRVRSLDQYNAATGQNLPFVVAFADETAALLEHPGTKPLFVELARLGRKSGVGMMLGSTDFKATTLPSEARSHCQARIAFWLERGLSQSLLDCNDATELGGVGEIVVKKPGIAGTVRGRSPNVTEAAYKVLPLRQDRVLTLDVATVASSPSGNGNGNGGRVDLDAIDDPSLPDVDRVRLLHEAGASDSAIAGRVWHSNPFYLQKVRDILASPVVVVADGDQEDGDNTPGDQEHNNNNNTGDFDFCDFCRRDGDSMPDGVTFATCARCGVAICSDCLADAGGDVCPDCAGSEGV